MAKLFLLSFLMLFSMTMSAQSAEKLYEEGKKLFVNHMKDVEAGKTVEFDKVLLVDNEGSVQVGAPTVDGAKVVCEVVNPLVKGEKVIVFKMKRRKDSRKKNGHRQQYTQVEVKSVIA